MNTFLKFCEGCADTLGLTMTILLGIALAPLILAVGLLLFVVAVPIGIISSLLGLSVDNRGRLR